MFLLLQYLKTVFGGPYLVGIQNLDTLDEQEATVKMSINLSTPSAMYKLRTRAKLAWQNCFMPKGAIYMNFYYTAASWIKMASWKM